MIDRKYESIALMPCVEKHPMSTKVPERIYTESTNACVRYHCKFFVDDLLFMNELEGSRAYLVFGVFDSAKQRIIYRMKTSIDAVSLTFPEEASEGSDENLEQIWKGQGGVRNGAEI